MPEYPDLWSESFKRCVSLAHLPVKEAYVLHCRNRKLTIKIRRRLFKDNIDLL